MPPLDDNENETITLRGDADKLGNALTLVYEKVITHLSWYIGFENTENCHYFLSIIEHPSFLRILT